MNNRTRNYIALSIIPQIILVKWLGSYPELVEKYYSNGLYPFISKIFRTLLGWIPFSIGDLIYTALIFIAIRYVYVNIRRIKTHKIAFLRDVSLVLSIFYFTFHLVWGFNYYRVPISKTLDLQETHSYNDLILLTERLIDKINETQLLITLDSATMVKTPYDAKEIYQKTIEGYKSLEKEYPFLKYHQPSIKTSLYSLPLTYMGYGGYLNPFTNEAQVNSKLPKFRLPIVSGHEVGHQIGYSAENETNFIGHLVTYKNKDPYFKYSAYFHALSYCLNDINRKDKKLFKEFYGRLNLGVQKNFKELQAYWEHYENPLEPVFKSMFNTFLKANNQSEGIKSYSSVVTLLVTYHMKNRL
ncbi:MAG: amino acid permease [Flavobacteriaceae bacterium]|nr:MAG: amino acid permease [Flavobacteriaceae bacterium]